jgi:hypothetical protein
MIGKRFTHKLCLFLIISYNRSILDNGLIVIDEFSWLVNRKISSIVICLNDKRLWVISLFMWVILLALYLLD